MILPARLQSLMVSQTRSVKPTGTDFTFVARSEPTDGVDVFLGPDLYTKVKSVIDSKCGAKRDPDCQSSIQELLKPTDVALATRAVPLLGIVAGFVGLLGIVWEYLVSNDKNAYQVHIPGDDIAKISSASDAQVSTILVATTAGDPHPITISTGPADASPTR